jgi:probable F420-dependent oxidoreductase
MRIDKLAVWLNTIGYPSADLVAFARRLEGWGYGTLWINDGMGSDPMVLAARILAGTERLQVALGVANIYSRDPTMMIGAQYGLNEQWDGRFLLGIGASHAFIVEGMRGHSYQKPVATMRAYLEAMEKALYMGVSPKQEAPIVLAALRPKMLALARDKARGAHPYFVTPEHTARAREILGRGPWLCPEQMVLLETNPANARAIARKHILIYTGLPNYQNNLRDLGFADADFQNGGSDRLVDAIVAWGDEKAIAARIQAHHDAGADHVCIQAFRADGDLRPDLKLLEALAPGAS